MELFKAHQQWKNRPDDERFPTLEALYAATKAYTNVAVEAEAPYSSLRVEAIDGNVQLIGKAQTPAHLTHWSFGQLAQRVGAPAHYLRQLPATLAVQNLNHGLAKRIEDGDDTAKMLFHTNGSLLCRAITSDRYERIWNYEVAERLMDLQEQGWEPAVPDFNTFGSDRQTALYASDHDLFAFLRSKNVGIKEPGADEPLWRGLIAENSEVGAGKIKATKFLYRRMCGNHIIWGASKVIEFGFAHIGDVRERWTAFQVTAKRWLDDSVSDDEQMVAEAKELVIGATKEQVLDALFGQRSLGLSRKIIEAGYDAVVPEQDGDPNTKWGVVQGLTRYSQTIPYADQCKAIDRAAGRILTIQF